MITKTDSRGVQNGKELVRLAFKSTDSKPTTGIMNGSTGIEVNTGKQYVYDEESGEWTEIASSGGGSGGSSDFSTAEVTVVSSIDPLMLPLPSIWGGDLEFPAGLFISLPLFPDTYTVPLYKGRLEVWGASDWTVNCTGNIEFSDSVFIITGDGSITISAGE